MENKYSSIPDSALDEPQFFSEVGVNEDTLNERSFMQRSEIAVSPQRHNIMDFQTIDE